MQKTYRLSLSLVLISCLVLSFGCRGGRAKPEGLPDLHPCTLTFTQEGAPLVGANIALRSSDPSYQWSVGGRTDQQGMVSLVTNGYYDGAPLGTFKVTVRKIVEQMEGEKVVKLTDVIPRAFQTADTSTLELDIVKGAHTQTFDLGKPASVNMPIED